MVSRKACIAIYLDEIETMAKEMIETLLHYSCQECATPKATQVIAMLGSDKHNQLPAAKLCYNVYTSSNL